MVFDNKKILTVSAITLIISFTLVLVTCFNPVNSQRSVVENTNTDRTGELKETPDGTTRIAIGLHDASGQHNQGIEAINLSVIRMDIINAGSRYPTTIMDQKRTVDILGASKSNPVILSDISIEPGTYSELRLILSDNNTIQVNGEVHPLRVRASGHLSLSLQGPFIIPEGFLFTLMIELDVDRSVILDRVQGYLLHPVLHISNGDNVLGIFRGYLTAVGAFGVNETLLQLYSDNTARLRIETYPNYTLYGNYVYNSVARNLHLTNITLDAPGLGRKALGKVMKQIPNEIVFPVKQWSLDSIIAIDTGSMSCNLYRIDSFDFSDGVSYAEFTLTIRYPDTSMSGKPIITEIQFVDTGMPPLLLLNKLSGNSAIESVRVLNSYIQGTSTRLSATSYLFESEDDFTLIPGVYASRPTIIMGDSYPIESTINPWENAQYFTLYRNSSGQTYTVNYPPSLHISMNHANFTNNNPIISWDAYPGAAGYFVAVLGENKNGNATNNLFELAYYAYTKDTQIQVQSDKIKFTTPDATVKKGDFLRIEVFVLDGSGKLNTKTREGGLFMDSMEIIRY